MATIKLYTDISQSKKLAEILPLESADMYYDGYGRLPQGYAYTLTSPNSFEYDYPCWSLAALLNVMPQSITKYIESERCQKTFHLNLFRSYYHCCSYSFISSVDDDNDNTLYCIGRDNWIDACYEMILKLHELKIL